MYSKPDNTFRVVHQNVNGIPFSKDGFCLGLAFYKGVQQVKADAFSLTETNLEWLLPCMKGLMRDIAKLFHTTVCTEPSMIAIKFKKLGSREEYLLVFAETVPVMSFFKIRITLVDGQE